MHKEMKTINVTPGMNFTDEMNKCSKCNSLRDTLDLGEFKEWPIDAMTAYNEIDVDMSQLNIDYFLWCSGCKGLSFITDMEAW